VHNHATGFGELGPGTALGPFRVTISAAANERYWQAAGVDHPRLRAGALYPPIAANLTILTFQQACPEAMIQTHQRIVCHRGQAAGAELVVRGEVTTAYAKRGRDYVDCTLTIATAADDAPLWTSEVTFTPAATVRAEP
jgi:hypothetical protein